MTRAKTLVTLLLLAALFSAAALWPRGGATVTPRTGLGFGTVLTGSESRAVLGGRDKTGEEKCECCCDCPNDESVGYGMHISIARGTVFTHAPICTIESNDGPTIDFGLFYDSGKADGSIGWNQTVLGRGWTHTYNRYLIVRSQRVFCAEESGRLALFTRRFDGAYRGSKGETRTLARLDADTFVLDNLSGTRMTFELFDPQPWPEAGELYLLTLIRDAQGRETTLSYDALGLLETITDPYDRQVSFTHTPTRRISTITGPDGVTVLDYQDTDDDLVRITDPLGHTIDYTYDALDRMRTEKTKDGDTWTCFYNGGGRPARLVDGEGRTVAALSNPTNWAIDNDFALQNDLIRYLPSRTEVTDGCGNVTTYHHDELGSIWKIVDPLGFEKTYTHNDDLRLVGKCDEDGNCWSYEYDEHGNQTRIEDPMGHVTHQAYGHAIPGLMTAKTEPDGDSWAYERDALGNIITEIDPIVEQPTDAVIRHAYTYFAAGLPGRIETKTTTDRNGNTTLHEYNPDGTLLRRTIDPGGLALVAEYEHDAAGRVTRQTVFRGPGLTDPVVNTLAYDAMGRVLTEVTDPDGLALTTHNEYDGEGNKIRVTDPRGVAIEFGYDARDRLTETIVDPGGLGLVSQTIYDDCDNAVAELDPNGNLTSFEYDARNRLVRVIDGENHRTEFTYDGRGNTTSVSRTVEPGGGEMRTTGIEYDELSRTVRTIADPGGLGLTTEYDYAAQGGCGCHGTPGDALVHRVTDAEGQVTYFYYDRLDRNVREVRKVGDTADNEGDPDDSITVIEYDLMFNPVRITFENDPGTDLVGEYAYDAADRLVLEVAGPGGSAVTTAYQYDGAGNLVEETTPVGNVVVREYDAADRQVRVSDSIGVISEVTYDANGNLLTRADGLGNTWAYEYDAADRVIIVCDPLVEEPADKCSLLEYDANSNLIAITDREGVVTEYAYDGLDRTLSTTTDPGGLSITVHSAYDGLDNITAQTDDNGNTTRYEYDAADRLVREIGADGTRIGFDLDRVGNTVARTDQLGNITRYTYDDLHRLVERDYAQETPVDRADVFAYDRIGQLLSADNEHSRVGYAYDDIGRTVSSTQTDLPQTYAHSVGYVYSESPNTRTLVYPSGKAVEEQYDARNRLEAVLQDGSPVAWYTYEDPSDRLISRGYANGTETVYAHSENDWLTEIRHLAPDGTTTFAGFAYDHNSTGNPISARNLQETIPYANTKPVTHSERYGYDRAYRLIEYGRGQWSGDGVPFPRRHRTWQLDGVQNWTAYSIHDLDTGENAEFCNTVNQMNEYDDPSTDGPPAVPDDDGLADDFMVSPCVSTGPFAGGPVDSGPKTDVGLASSWAGLVPTGDGQPPNAASFAAAIEKAFSDGSPSGPTGFNRAHDKNGNLVDDGTRLFFYDHDDRPVSDASLRGPNRLTRVEDRLTGITLGEYRYDALGRRISAIGPTETVRYTYELNWRIIEEHADGLRRREYVFGAGRDDILIAESSSSGERHYFHRNALQSSIALSADDGSVVERYHYDAYGTPAFSDPDGEPRPMSAVGNAFLFTGREYDRDTGLFCYRNRYADPESGRFLTSDPIGVWGDPASLGNAYALVGNSPIGHLDPMGLARARSKPESTKCDAAAATAGQTATLETEQVRDKPGADVTGVCDLTKKKKCCKCTFKTQKRTRKQKWTCTDTHAAAIAASNTAKTTAATNLATAVAALAAANESGVGVKAAQDTETTARKASQAADLAHTEVLKAANRDKKRYQWIKGPDSGDPTDGPDRVVWYAVKPCDDEKCLKKCEKKAKTEWPKKSKGKIEYPLTGVVP